MFGGFSPQTKSKMLLSYALLILKCSVICFLTFASNIKVFLNFLFLPHEAAFGVYSDNSNMRLWD